MSISLFDWIYSLSFMCFFSLMIAIFIAFKKQKPQLVNRIGIAFLSLSIPIGLVLINYIFIGQDLWKIIMLIITLGQFLLQYLLDYLFKYDFQSNWKTYVP